MCGGIYRVQGCVPKPSPTSHLPSQLDKRAPGGVGNKGGWGVDMFVRFDSRYANKATLVILSCVGAL